MSQTQKSIWQKVLLNKQVFFSSLFLLFAFLVSVFAVLVITDKSPKANHQQLELALKPPGYKAKILQLKRTQIFKEKSFIAKIISGINPKYDDLPINDFKIDNKQISVTNINGVKKILDLDQIVLIKGSNQPAIKERSYFLGTDKFGRDIFSRLVLGIRLSLFIGLMAVIISLLIGITIGASGGYFGGRVDVVVMYLINITWSVPTLLLVFAIVLAFGRGVEVVFIAIALTLWVDVARIVRGQVLKIRNEEFIIAAKSLSYHPIRIIGKHILPNIIGPLLVVAATNFAVAILIEAGLSYLGFGIQPPTPSIGNMLHENYGYAVSGKAFLALVPSITIMLLVLAFNLVGSGLRDIYDVKRLD